MESENSPEARTERSCMTVRSASPAAAVLGGETASPPSQESRFTVASRRLIIHWCGAKRVNLIPGSHNDKSVMNVKTKTQVIRVSQLYQYYISEKAAKHPHHIYYYVELYSYIKNNKRSWRVGPAQVISTLRSPERCCRRDRALASRAIWCKARKAEIGENKYAKRATWLRSRGLEKVSVRMKDELGEIWTTKQRSLEWIPDDLVRQIRHTLPTGIEVLMNGWVLKQH